MSSLELLIKKFEEHAVEFAERQKELKKKWLLQNKGKRMPDHYIDDFNLSEALCTICKEIEQLKNK